MMAGAPCSPVIVMGSVPPSPIVPAIGTATALCFAPAAAKMSNAVAIVAPPTLIVMTR